MGLLDGGETGHAGHLTSAEETWTTAQSAHNNQGAGTRVCLWDDGTSRCLAIYLVNRTGGNTTKGYIASASTSYDGAFRYTPVNNPDAFGIVLESGIADGSPCWLAVSGAVEVYFGGNATRGQFARATVTADGYADGQAIAEALPSSPFATDKHFQEIGHVIQSRTGAGLALCVIHFN